MESVEQILERQYADIKFKDGKVNYFSISTQHGIADTIEETINSIVEADKEYEGKSSLRYVVEKLEAEYSMPDKIDISDLDLEVIGKLYKDCIKKSFGYK